MQDAVAKDEPNKQPAFRPEPKIVARQIRNGISNSCRPRPRANERENGRPCNILQKTGRNPFAAFKPEGLGPRRCQRSWAWVFYSCRYKWRTVASQLLHSCLTIVSQLSLICVEHFACKRKDLSLDFLSEKQNFPTRLATTVRQL